MNPGDIRQDVIFLLLEFGVDGSETRASLLTVRPGDNWVEEAVLAHGSILHTVHSNVHGTRLLACLHESTVQG